MKQCGSCTACCIAPELDALGKEMWQPCAHLNDGCVGCSIYEERPQACADYRCVWLDIEKLPDKFRPDRCGFMLRAQEAGIQVWELTEEPWEGSALHRHLWFTIAKSGAKVQVIRHGDREGRVLHG